MDIDERLHALTAHAEQSAKRMEGFEEQLQKSDARFREELQGAHDRFREGLQESDARFNKRSAKIDANIEALTFNVQIMSDMMKDFLKAHHENEIRYKLLASVVEQHGTRLDKLDSGK